MSLQPFVRLDKPTLLGEGPIFRASDNTLHFVDIRENKIFVLPIDPASGEANVAKMRTLNIRESISAIYFRKNKPGYAVMYYQGVGFVDEETGELEVVKEVIPDSEKAIRRFNDGCVDPKGRYWTGEMDLAAAAKGVGNFDHHPVGRLWRYDPDGSLHEMDSGLVCSNGIGWSPDLTKMYLNDSIGQKIYVYDYNNETGTIANRRVLRDFVGTKEEPDGLVVDASGNLWSAMFGGYRILVLSPEGEILREIPTAAANPTCPAWGGPNNDILYVTSASIFSPEGSGDGQLYSTKAVKGMPHYEFGA